MVLGGQPGLALGAEEDVDTRPAAVRHDDVDITEHQISGRVIAKALLVLDNRDALGIGAAPVVKIIEQFLGVPLGHDEVPGHVRQHLAGDVGRQLGVVSHVAGQPEGSGHPPAQGRMVVDMVLLSFLAGHARALLAQSDGFYHKSGNLWLVCEGEPPGYPAWRTILGGCRSGLNGFHFIRVKSVHITPRYLSA